MRLTRTMLLVCSFIILVHKTESENGIRLVKERPKKYGDSIPYKTLMTSNARVRNKIVKIHNFYRSKVKPTSSNMLKMSWSKEAAKTAQNWADSCVYLTHGGTKTKSFGNCGQNIFVSSEKVPWVFAIRSWFMEKDDFVYGSLNQTEVVGHYTQLVWATSHKVGCGIAKCKSKEGNGIFFNYICNYCPSGNIEGLSHVPYKKGKPCGKCKNSCFDNKLCTNSCRYRDKYSNCAELYKKNPKTFCQMDGKGCGGVCKCKGKIIQRYDQLV